MKGKLKLFIDTSTNKKTLVKLGERSLTRDSSVWHSQVVLPMIAELLKKQKKKLSDVSEIEVVTSGPSFTGLRVGAAIANALGFVLGVPVNGQKQVAPEY